MDNSMTNDTERALKAIEPIAKILNIKVSADAFFLYCNGQAIGISCNSTYATVKEFLGYAMHTICRRPDCRFEMPIELSRQIRQLWCSGEKVEEVHKKFGVVKDDG